MGAACGGLSLSLSVRERDETTRSCHRCGARCSSAITCIGTSSRISVQRLCRETSDTRYTVEGKLLHPYHESTQTRASLLDKARHLRGQLACVDGAFVALHLMQQQPPEPDECILEDMAVMVLQSRHQQSLALRNLESDSLRNLDTVIEAVDVRCVMLCVETGEIVSSSAVMALADGISVPVHLDTAFSRYWHKPVTYRNTATTCVHRKGAYGVQPWNCAWTPTRLYHFLS